MIKNEVVILREIEFNRGVINDIDGSNAGMIDPLGGIRLSTLALTAWALKGVPSWNVTPCLSLNVMVFPSAEVSQLRANIGLYLPSSPVPSKRSKMAVHSPRRAGNSGWITEDIGPASYQQFKNAAGLRLLSRRAGSLREIRG